MISWIDFWNTDHAIYVNERHKQAHAAALSSAIAGYIPAPDAIILDYGCGEALYADQIHGRCGELLLFDAAPKVRNELQRRTGDLGSVTVLDQADIDRLAPASLDLILAISLIQYLDEAAMVRVLGVWRQKLKREGRLILADVVPPTTSPVADAAALLSFGWRSGFLLPALTGLARTALSDYGRLRRELGFSMYTEQQIIDLLHAAGFAARRTHPNVGHNQARMTFIATCKA